MLSILLDEQISPEIAKQVQIKHPEITIFSMHHWHQGHFLGMSDEAILQAAKIERLTLITYDQKTIPPILVNWGRSNIDQRSGKPRLFKAGNLTMQE